MTAIRWTRQRNAILKEVLSAEVLLSIAEKHGRAGGKVLGLGIVGLSDDQGFEGVGEVAVAELAGEEPRYEPVGLEHHHHFRCLTCEQTFDLDICPVGIPRGTTLPGGYTIEDHSLTLYGRCAGCG